MQRLSPTEMIERLDIIVARKAENAENTLTRINLAYAEIESSDDAYEADSLHELCNRVGSKLQPRLRHESLVPQRDNETPEFDTNDVGDFFLISSQYSSDLESSEEFVEVLDDGEDATTNKIFDARILIYNDQRYVIFDPVTDDITDKGWNPEPSIDAILKVYQQAFPQKLYENECKSEILLLPLIQCNKFYFKDIRREHYVLAAIVDGKYMILDSQSGIRELAYPDPHKTIAFKKGFNYSAGFFGKNYINYNNQTDEDSCGVYVLETIEHIIEGNINLRSTKQEINNQLKNCITQGLVEQSKYKIS